MEKSCISYYEGRLEFWINKATVMTVMLQHQGQRGIPSLIHGRTGTAPETVEEKLNFSFNK